MAYASTTSMTTQHYYPRRLREKYRISLPHGGHDSLRPYATIPFHPDLSQFIARARRSHSHGISTDLPHGRPREVRGPMTWKGSNFNNDRAFIYQISIQELREIDEALRDFQSRNLPVEAASIETFPLQRFAARLAAVQHEVYHGIGCKVLRGLDVSRYTADELSIIFCGISAYIAKQRGKQDQDGTIIKHIVDFDRAESKLDLPFHTDVVCDVVAMLTRECSGKGGKGTLASAWTVYNDLGANRADLLQVLAEPDWPLDTFGRSPAFYRRALLYHVDGKVILNFSRRILTGHPLTPRTKGIPGLTERQAEALDAVHFSARAHQTLVSMEKGDIRFINNMAMLHGREAFGDDGDSPEMSKRHLIRLWLANPSDDRHTWKLPHALQLAWDRTFEDDERASRWESEPCRDERGQLVGIQMSTCD